MNKKKSTGEIESDIVPANGVLDQSDIEDLFKLNDFIQSRQDKNHSLLEEIKRCILDSGKLSLTEWEALRDNLREIEEFIPMIDLIIRLKLEHVGED